MKIDLWLLDVSHEAVEDVDEVRLWGVDSRGKRVLVIDKSYHPSLFVLVGSQEIGLAVRQQAERTGALTTQIEDKRLFGRPTKAVKVTFETQEQRDAFVKTATESGYETLHDDLRLSSQYLLETGCNASGWNNIEVQETERKVDVDVEKVFEAKSRPVAAEKMKVPALRILCFATVTHRKMGSPNPQEDPVLAISTITYPDGKVSQFTAQKYEDRAAIKSFIHHVNQYDPDIILGFGINRNELPFLAERAMAIGIKLGLGRDHGEPHRSVYGHISILGRASLDLLDYAEEIPAIKLKTLESMARHFSLHLPDLLSRVDELDTHGQWENAEKRKLLVQYCSDRARTVFEISKVILEYAMQLSNLIGIPLDHVGPAATGFKVDWYLIREAYRLGELVPKRTEQPYFPYRGAIVTEPTPGLHEQISVLDFSAMYPNLMIKYNLSPETLVPKDEKVGRDEVFTAPEVAHRFRKKPEGFYAKIISDLIDARKSIQRKMEKTQKDSPAYRALDSRQRSIKTITNAVYGYCGWTGARWYVREVAEATAAWGRSTILSMIEIAKKNGLQVLYSDTDSIFVEHNEKKIRKLLEDVQKQIGLATSPATMYERVLFTEAKKRYAGLTEDGTIEIVGLEVARGDWAEVAKTVQEKVVEIILKEKDARKASLFVRDYIDQIRSRKIPLRNFVIWKTISKSLEDYEVRAPHVEAARRMISEGWKLSVGDAVGFVIAKGAGKLFEKAVPYPLAKAEDLDFDYYVENQVLPSALRILEIFKVSRQDLLKNETPNSKSLLDFA